MGRNPWDDADLDLVAMQSGMRGSRGMSWGRVLVGLVVIGVITFVGAFYVPLHRSHAVLSQEHGRMAERAKGLEETLARQETESRALQQKLQTLESERSERQSGSEKSAAEIENLSGSVAAALERHSKRGVATVARDGDRVVVGAAYDGVFVARKLDVSQQGRAVLCDVAKAASGRPIAVRAVDGDSPPAAPLSEKYSTALSLRAARAASAAEVLITKCGVKPDRVVASAVGRPSSSRESAVGKAGAERIELEIAATGE